MPPPPPKTPAPQDALYGRKAIFLGVVTVGHRFDRRDLNLLSGDALSSRVDLPQLAIAVSLEGQYMLQRPLSERDMQAFALRQFQGADRVVICLRIDCAHRRRLVAGNPHHRAVPAGALFVGRVDHGLVKSLITYTPRWLASSRGCASLPRALGRARLVFVLHSPLIVFVLSYELVTGAGVRSNARRHRYLIHDSCLSRDGKPWLHPLFTVGRTMSRKNSSPNDGALIFKHQEID